MEPKNVEFWWTVIVWVSVSLVLLIGFASVLISQSRVRLRLQAEKIVAIEKSRKEYIDLFDNVSDIVFIHDLQGKFSVANQSVTRIFGYEVNQVVGHLITELLPSREKRIEEYLRNVSRMEGEVAGIVPIWSHKAGKMVVLEFRCTPIMSAGGLVAVRGIARDVTDTIERERVVAKANLRIRRMLENEKLLKEKLEQFSQEILRVQEEDRLWISRELHDEVGQYLASILFNLELLRTDHNRLAGEYDNRLDATRVVAESVLERVRKFLSELRPAPIDERGINETLTSLVNNFTMRTGLAIAMKQNHSLDQLEYNQKVSLYRAVQESLSNIAKHSHAKTVEIEFTSIDENNVMIEIRDDGIGFDPLKVMKKGGLGLTGMRERLKLTNGCLTIDSKIGSGTRVKISFQGRVTEEKRV